MAAPAQPSDQRSPILPAIPAGVLAPGRALTTDDLRDRLEQLGREDPEAGHSALDSLLIAALEVIRDGHPDPVGVATAVLTVEQADFSRWCA